MQIAITADTHLTSLATNPERFSSLEEICSASADLGISHVLLAGDIYNQKPSSPGDLESILGRFTDLSFHWIPGNHDFGLSSSMTTLDNLIIYERPSLIRLSPNSPPFLFIPYVPHSTMGDHIEPFSDELPADGWYLVSHGDWTGSLKAGNPLEPGVYMPLTRLDTSTYLPKQVFLGHIHQPVYSELVHYPGSPCGLDITETGRRSFIVLDTLTGRINRVPLQTDILFFNESFFVVPVENETDAVRSQIHSRIDSWNLTEDERSRVVIRVRVHGYTHNRRSLADVIQAEFDGYAFYKDEGPDLSDLRQSEDPERAHLARETAALIRRQQWTDDPLLPGVDDIVAAALAVIFED